jgi:hypothetical protein
MAGGPIMIITPSARLARLSAAVLLCVLLGSCDETDATSIRLTLAADGSGTVRISSVAVPEPRPLIETDSSGATWEHSVSVEASVGRFDDLAQLRLADLEFHRDVNDRGLVTLEVVVPVGRDARWVRQLSPMTPAERADTARAFDERGRTKALGGSVKLEIEVPQDIVSSELDTYVPAVSPSRRGRTATLILPVDGADQRPDQLSWIITWRRQ